MSYYLKALEKQVKQAALQQEAQCEACAATEAEAAREHLTPLDERLKRALASIPIEVQREGLSLVALQARFQARGNGHMHCHVGELGAALRRLGFRRERRWSNDADGFRALWYPPKRQ